MKEKVIFLKILNKIREEYKTVRYTKQDIISYQRLAMYSILEELYNKIKNF